MNCEDCGTRLRLIENESCVVCLECGKTMPIITSASPSSYGENVNICLYSRKKRFEVMARALLYPSFDRKDEHVYKHLKTTHDTLPNLESLRVALKACPIKEKRYHSVHLFSKLLCEDHIHIHPPSPEFFRRLMRLFDEILCCFKVQQRQKFFSYPWLLKKLLHIADEFRYDKYIKQIRCSKRNFYYEQLFSDILLEAPASYTIFECGTMR